MSLPTKATFILAGSFGAFLSFTGQQTTVETVQATAPNTTQLTAINTQPQSNQNDAKASPEKAVSDI